MNVTRISQRAAEIRPARVLLAVLVAPLYAIGFVVAVLFVALTWLGAAAVEGFEAGRNAVPLGREERTE